MNAGVIIIEGNIGAGKSTFAQHLANALDGEYLPEPADGSNPYLEDYYKDPSRWAFEMQMFLLTKRYRAQKYAQSKIRHNGGFVVLDRSYYGDVCFANVQRKMLYFSERDYSTYLSHHSDMKTNLEPPAMAIFLNVSPEICQARIEKRLTEKMYQNFQIKLCVFIRYSKQKKFPQKICLDLSLNAYHVLKC